MERTELLRGINFGSRVAEDESDELQNYFIETDQWRQVYQDEADIIYGPKGSGKSAIYTLLQARSDDLFDRNILTTTAENPRGKPAFKTLNDEEFRDEQELRVLWKLYFAAIISETLEDYGIKGKDATRLYDALAEAKLRKENRPLKALIFKIKNYIKTLNASMTVGVEPNTGITAVSGKIKT